MSEPESPEDLLTRAQREYPGSNDAYGELMVKHLRPKLERYAKSRLLITEDPIDLVQTTFSAMSQNPKDYRDIDHISGISMSILKNKIVDFIRRKKSPIHGGDVEHVPLQSIVDIDVADSRLDTPENNLIAAETRARLLGRLDPKEHPLFHHVEEGRANADIAREKGKTIRTVERDIEGMRIRLLDLVPPEDLPVDLKFTRSLKARRAEASKQKGD